MLPYINQSRPPLGGIVLLNLQQDYNQLNNLLDQSNKDTFFTMDVEKGELITIKIPGKPSSGYQWRIKSNTCGSGLVRDGEPIFYRDSFLGSGLEGVYYFNFKSPAEGSNGMKCLVEFKYSQPWPNEGGFSKFVEFHLF